MESVRAACSLVLLLHVIGATALTLKTPEEDIDTTLGIPTSAFPEGHICRSLFPAVPFISVPNPLLAAGCPVDWFKQALTDFQYFNIFKTISFCSEKIYTLLCFFYFPIWANDMSIGSNKNFTIYPCKDVCEEVTREDSNCTQLLEQAQKGFSKKNKGWPIHFKHCNYTYRAGSQAVNVYKNSLCVSFSHESTRSPKTLVPKKICGKIDPLHASDCKCNPRRRLSKNLFLNNRYNYAIECQVNSITTVYGREAINCTVNYTYAVNCTESAAKLDENILILGEEDSTNCNKSCFGDVVVGGKYLVAGNYVERKHCEDDLWFATEVSDKKATLVLSTKHSKKKMTDALNRFRKQRCVKH